MDLEPSHQSLPVWVDPAEERWISATVDRHAGRVPIWSLRGVTGSNVPEVAQEMAKGRPSLFFYDPVTAGSSPPRGRPHSNSIRQNAVHPLEKEFIGGGRPSIQRQADALNELADAGPYAELAQPREMEQ